MRILRILNILQNHDFFMNFKTGFLKCVEKFVIFQFFIVLNVICIFIIIIIIIITKFV